MTEHEEKEDRMQITYHPDGTATVDLEPGARAYPMEDDHIRDLDVTCTFTDGLENVMIVDERSVAITIRVGDEEMIVFRPRYQRFLDACMSEDVDEIVDAVMAPEL